MPEQGDVQRVGKNDRERGSIVNAPGIIERLERILAAPFWSDNSKRCVVETATIEISGQPGDYRWIITDIADGSHGGLRGPFPTVDDAKESARLSLEVALNRYRERDKRSTQS
jgi:hypothetical protein